MIVDNFEDGHIYLSRIHIYLLRDSITYLRIQIDFAKDSMPGDVRSGDGARTRSRISAVASPTSGIQNVDKMGRSVHTRVRLGLADAVPGFGPF